MPTDNAVEAAPANGTEAEKPLTTSVGEKLGALDEAKLSALLRKSFLNEPGEEPAKPAPAQAEEKPVEETSEEAPAKAEADEDTNDLSQELTQQTSDEETSEAEAPEAKAEEPAAEEGLPKGAQKRIDKLTAARKAAEAKAAQLEAEINALKQKLDAKPAVDDAPVRPTPDNPYLHLQTQADVDSAISEARKVRRWAEEHPDGTTVRDANGKETEYSAEDIRRIKLNAIDALEEHLPRQLQYVQARAQIDPQAESTYSWWKDKTSREYQAAQNMLKAFPELRKFPDYKMVVGDYLRGAQARESEYARQKSGQAAAKPAVKKAPAQPSRPAIAPPTVTPQERNAKDAVNRFRKAPNSDSLKDVVLSQFL